MHEGLGLEDADATGYRVLKLDADQANEGVVVYEYVGAIEPDDIKYSMILADDLGKRWGEGTYLVIDLSYGTRKASEYRVVMDEPSYSTYEEPEEDDEPTAEPTARSTSERVQGIGT